MPYTAQALAALLTELLGSHQHRGLQQAQGMLGVMPLISMTPGVLALLQRLMRSHRTTQHMSRCSKLFGAGMRRTL